MPSPARKLRRRRRTAAAGELGRAATQIPRDPSQRTRLSPSESSYLGASVARALLAEPQIDFSGETCASCGRPIDVLAHCRCSD